ncbi:MAG TPA: hypothetical protein DIW47_15005 [Bacteroidetes bacterium]|nr:hypothetical protein [Bacteroidota bacterium]
MKNLIFLTFFASILASCSEISEDDLKIIEGIHLGKNLETFKNETARLPNKQFVIGEGTSDPNEFRDRFIECTFSEIFDNPGYGTDKIRHLALIVPSKTLGSNNVEVVTVYICNSRLTSEYPENFLPRSDGLSTIDQTVHDLIISEALEMLKVKYGPPEQILSGYGVYSETLAPKFQITQKPANQEARMFVWETKAIRISFFEGERTFSTYKPKMSYYHVTEEYMNDTVTSSNVTKGLVEMMGHLYTRKGAYIKYSLKPDVRDKLKLDKPNL